MCQAAKADPSYCYVDMMFMAAKYGHIDICRQIYVWEQLYPHHCIRGWGEEPPSPDIEENILMVLLDGAIIGKQYDMIAEIFNKNATRPFKVKHHRNFGFLEPQLLPAGVEDILDETILSIPRKNAGAHIFPICFVFCRALELGDKQLAYNAYSHGMELTSCTLNRAPITAAQLIDGIPWTNCYICCNDYDPQQCTVAIMRYDHMLSREHLREALKTENLAEALIAHDRGGTFDYDIVDKIFYDKASLYWWKLLFLWAPNVIDGCMVKAGAYGNEALCELAKSYGGHSFVQLFKDAVLNSKNRICWLTKQWYPAITKRLKDLPIPSMYRTVESERYEIPYMIAEWCPRISRLREEQIRKKVHL
jgi:hypothetical protein